MKNWGAAGFSVAELTTETGDFETRVRAGWGRRPAARWWRSRRGSAGPG